MTFTYVEPGSELKPPDGSVAVFICSSDSRKDILGQVMPSFFRYWPNCPYPIYVGLNTRTTEWAGVTSVTSKPTGWRQESLTQLAQLRETSLIVVLDDFLFKAPVEQARVAEFVSLACESDFSYLRLLPLRRSVFERLLKFRPPSKVHAIREHRPFYSSLQIAIWKKTHFVEMLGYEGSIWDFEHRQIKGKKHFAITDKAPIAYSHLVEKGRWLPYAPSLLQKAGVKFELGVRPMWPKWMHLRLLLDEVRFHLFGYANH